MFRPMSFLAFAPILLAVLTHNAWCGESPPSGTKATSVVKKKARKLSWHTEYADAQRIAEKQGKMLFIFFHEPGENAARDRFEAECLSDPAVCRKLKPMIRVKVPLDQKITMAGEEVVVLEDRGFAEMLGRQGVAVVDYTDKNAEYYARVVSTFPFDPQSCYTVQQMLVILDLPPGTLTQRTLTYAVRMHPDAPASTSGDLDQHLAEEARSHADYQARIRLQGHHHWETRFHHINTSLPDGLVACEVCAESWPGETLVQAAIECVRCWRFSEGHWSAVRAYHPLYGYDMKRGSNQIWYAVGIFGKQH